MPLINIQKDVDDWVNQYKIGYWQPLEILTRLTEETGELAREINDRYGPKKKKTTEEKSEIADEVADILFTLCCLCNSLEIKMDDAWQDMIDKLYGRDKERFERKEETNSSYQNPLE